MLDQWYPQVRIKSVIYRLLDQNARAEFYLKRLIYQTLIFLEPKLPFRETTGMIIAKTSSLRYVIFIFITVLLSTCSIIVLVIKKHYLIVFQNISFRSESITCSISSNKRIASNAKKKFMRFAPPLKANIGKIPQKCLNFMLSKKNFIWKTNWGDRSKLGCCFWNEVKWDLKVKICIDDIRINFQFGVLSTSISILCLLHLSPEKLDPW